MKKLQEDIKTLEKAVYSQGVKTTSDSVELSTGDSDILTKHLLSELKSENFLVNLASDEYFKVDSNLSYVIDES